MKDFESFCSFLILFEVIFSFGKLSAFRVLDLKVPPLVDPRDNEFLLSCRFEMGTEELNSVKWYKDEQEFFRYTPRQQPHVMAFPVPGVHLVQHGVHGQGYDCGLERCTVRLTRLSTAHSGGSYRCEVSTEAPAFRVAFETANVTVAAVGKEPPQIDGFRTVYAPGDLLQTNCTASLADPPPNMSWLINGQPAPALAVTQPRTSRPDALGLVQRSIALRLHIERKHFREPSASLQLQCMAAPLAGVPAQTRTTTLSAQLAPEYLQHQQRNVVGNQKYEWLNLNNSNVSAQRQYHWWIFITASLTTFCWR